MTLVHNEQVNMNLLLCFFITPYQQALATGLERSVPVFPICIDDDGLSKMRTMYLFLFCVRKCVDYIYARAPSVQYPPRPEEHTRPSGMEVKGRGGPCTGNLCS